MKKFFTMFFVALGVVFFIILLAALYFVIMDPFELRPLIFGENGTSTPMQSGTTTDAHPLLSPAQERALETVGVDPASVPTKITPEQKACFEAELGTQRFAEIKGGDTPTMAEFNAARSCI